MKIGFYTLGCKVNQYETEILTELFVQNGYEVVPFEDICDVYVINTCTVTGISDKKSRQMIRKAKLRSPNSVMAVTGCYAQIKSQEVSQIEGVDVVTGTANRKQLPSLVDAFLKTRQKSTSVTDVMQEHTFETMTATGFALHTRANIKIQDGCNNFCSYCIIPFARGPVRSKALNDVLQEISALVQKGFSEIVLTGIHICSYGKDLDCNLYDLLKEIDGIEGNFRLRLGSLEPTLFTDEMAQKFSQLQKLCHHFHLSLQSGSDVTLKAMNRHYTAHQYNCAVAAIRTHMPDAMFTTDVIVGFPAETQEAFLSSCTFVQNIGFLQVHVFPFSKREGTRAAAFPCHLSNQEKADRSKHLTQLCSKTRADILKNQVGSTFEVLFEMNPKNDVYEGYSKNYLPVHVHSPKNLSLQTHKVLIVDAEKDCLMGELVI